MRNHSQYPWWFGVIMAPVILIDKIKDTLRKGGGKK